MAVAAAAVMGLLAAVATAIHKDLPPQPVAVAAPRAAAAEENRDLGHRLYEAGRNQLSQLLAEHGFAAAPVDIPRRDVRVMQRLEDAAGNRLSSQVGRPFVGQEEEKEKEKEKEKEPTGASYRDEPSPLAIPHRVDISPTASSLAIPPPIASSLLTPPVVNPPPVAPPLVTPPPITSSPAVSSPVASSLVTPPLVTSSLVAPPLVTSSLVAPPLVSTSPVASSPDASSPVSSSLVTPPSVTSSVVTSSLVAPPPVTPPPDASSLVAPPLVSTSPDASSLVAPPHVAPPSQEDSETSLATPMDTSSTKEPHDQSLTASSQAQQPPGDISDPDEPTEPLFAVKTIEEVSKAIVATHDSALTHRTRHIKLFDETDTVDRITQGVIEVVAPGMTKVKSYGTVMSNYRAKIALEDAFSKNFEAMIAKLQRGMHSHPQSANLYGFINMILATSYSVYEIEAGDIRALSLDVVLGDVPANLLKNSALKAWMNAKDAEGGIVKFLGLVSDAMKRGAGRGYDLEKILHMFQKKTMDKQGGLVLTAISPYKSLPMSCKGLGDATTALIDAISGLNDEHERTTAMKSVIGTLDGLLDGITCEGAGDISEINAAKAIISRSVSSDAEWPLFAWLRNLHVKPKVEHVIYNFVNPEIYEILLKKHNNVMVACNITADIAWLIVEYSEMKHMLEESTDISEVSMDPLTERIITTRPVKHDSMFMDFLGYAVMALSRPGIGDIRLAPAKAGFESYAGDTFLTLAQLMQLNIELVSKALPREESTVLGVDLVQSMRGVLVEFALLARQLKQFLSGVNTFQVYFGNLVGLADRCNTISNRIVLTLTKSVFERLKLKVCAKLGACDKLIGDGVDVTDAVDAAAVTAGGSRMKKELKEMLRTIKARLRVVKKALEKA